MIKSKQCSDRKI